MAKKGTKRGTNAAQPRTERFVSTDEPVFTRTPPFGTPSALLDTRVIYCGDNLEPLAKLPDRAASNAAASSRKPAATNNSR